MKNYDVINTDLIQVMNKIFMKMKKDIIKVEEYNY